jgi:hypothetical protein
VLDPPAKTLPPVEVEYQSKVFPGSFTANVAEVAEGATQKVPLMGATLLVLIIT